MESNQLPVQSDKEKSREQRFVETVIERCLYDKGQAARLRRADNPATEYQSWELLGWFGVDLEKDYERKPFVAIAAAIAKSKSERNGNLTLGRALASCYEDGRESNQAKARLRRLLACSDLTEVCRILRPLFTLIDSKIGQPLDYVRLLKQLRFFGFESGQRVKTQWAQEFYGQAVDMQKEEASV
ncbi:MULTISPECIES: type I-E CRISPR-associated protein Cse2/CasB [Idiomarina]|uniref:type I-E CRISPR-associated protein Cse2/CasB n=1 Tax=Idiomarina TaxID=135575 RepID=UPI00129D067D|nr:MULTISPECIES: type I-E CRISPR-associated protein Cse2/CasB [Idiomarina]MRJ43143.1 type I-E CRISPR-associated protein Cse2/CasB [Idiomarina sp. FeN1]NCU57155.1 type I-E CRISPR-associated protein Cse2/CasB [Idiomarina sp. FenA--70]NCU59864.1 type I-E CRISPR-associated protein Cse2/CasB [Idiomarina sp. FenBw--71]UUN13149.1 type I-E CRISPR-associated protein Cse2/CasB [Idiomarina loihiensis]